MQMVAMFQPIFLHYSYLFKKKLIFFLTHPLHTNFLNRGQKYKDLFIFFERIEFDT